jgi:hypothetical protein
MWLSFGFLSSRAQRNYYRKMLLSQSEKRSETMFHQNIFDAFQTIRSQPGVLDILRTSMTKRVHGALIQVEGILCICYGLWLDKQYGFCSY